MDWIAGLLTGPLLDGPADLGPWWSLARRTLTGTTTVRQAAQGGLAADRLGLAFVAGYQAALTRLVPDRDHGAVLGVAFTEQGGAHPRAIRSQLRSDDTGWRLHGTKGWVSCGTLATHLLVVASVGQWEDGRNRLRAVLVPVDAEGVRLEPHPPSSFVPEVPHAAVHFDGTPVPALLPGDGYTAWLKAFRTLEDVHVHAALLGHLIRVGREAAWPPEVLEGLLVPLLALDQLASMDPLDPVGHRVLGGVLADTERVVAALEPHWAGVADDVRSRWQRDRPLLRVASKARAARLARAREVSVISLA